MGHLLVANMKPITFYDAIKELLVLLGDILKDYYNFLLFICLPLCTLHALLGIDALHFVIRLPF